MRRVRNDENSKGDVDVDGGPLTSAGPCMSVMMEKEYRVIKQPTKQCGSYSPRCPTHSLNFSNRYTVSFARDVIFISSQEFLPDCCDRKEPQLPERQWPRDTRNGHSNS